MDYFPLRNRIPRLDSNGALIVGMNSTSKPYSIKLINTAGTEAISVKDTVGAFEFTTNSSINMHLSATAGWAFNEPIEAASTAGWALVFDEDRALWLFYKDNDIIGVVDGNAVSGTGAAFLTDIPVTTYAASEAYVVLDAANARIAFWCKTANDTTIKLCGFIDSTGTH